MNWIKIATVGQIEEDESLGVELEGKQLAVHHTEGEYFVTDNICTHQFALLSDVSLKTAVWNAPCIRPCSIFAPANRNPRLQLNP